MADERHGMKGWIEAMTRVVHSLQEQLEAGDHMDGRQRASAGCRYQRIECQNAECIDFEFCHHSTITTGES